ncbi:type II toxin-antitoxin system RelB family antitoxin [Xaviernesmea oryzae]|nr:CopG family transcriptional regulator [Xaviernesmea oryzae]SEL84388.1 RHH-type transcriptional regulator, rel operon repressor / antitoxin RelB [Xaviernesmea oryzae]
MNTRVTISMPEEMHRLILKHAAEAGAEPDSYMIEVLEQHLEDLHDVALAEAATARIKSGESKLISSQEMWGDMDD